MDNKEFVRRLKLIIKMRHRITRDDLVSILNTFWKHNKGLLLLEYQYYCYKILVNIIKGFDLVIESSNRRYYFCYSKKVLEFIKE